MTAASSTPLSYFWQRNGSNIAGANLSSYTANNVQLSDSGSVFSCLVNNSYSGLGASSNATLTVTPAFTPPPPPPPSVPMLGPMTVLYSFAGMDGGHPSAALVQGTDGNFYGTTEYRRKLSVWHRVPNDDQWRSGLPCSLFDNVHGAYPYGALVQGVDGRFYGTTDARRDSRRGHGLQPDR